MSTQNSKERARERLESYRRAVRDSKYFCQPRIETLREQMTSCTRAVGATSAGWTGEYITVVGKKEEGKPAPLPSDVSIPVKRIPRALHGTCDPQAGEKYLTYLITLIMEYEQRIERNNELCRTIEVEIDAFCDSEQALALKLRYIEGLTHTEAMRRLNHSRPAWFRLFSSALEAYGGKIETV
jgi:hypothetical protein